MAKGDIEICCRVRSFKNGKYNTIFAAVGVRHIAYLEGGLHGTLPFVSSYFHPDLVFRYHP